MAGRVSIPRDLSKAKEIIKDKYDARRLLAEEEIRESERKYRELYETVKDGIRVVNLEGKFLECNQALLDMLGYSTAEIRKKRYQDITPKKWHKMEAKILADQIKARGYSDEYEKEYIKKDGTIFPISIRAWLKKDREGRYAGTWAVIRDITERKRAEEVLRESEERHRAIFERAADSIVLVDAETGALVEFNDRAHENLGYTREEFEKLKIPCFEVIESTEEVTKHIKKIIKEGADTFGTKHRTKGGEIRDIQVSSKAISIRGRNFVQSLWLDITERKQAEEDRAKAIATTAATIEGIIDVVGISDMEGRVIQINKAVENWGYKKEEVIGKPVVKFLTQRSLAKLEGEKKKTLKTGFLENLELIGTKEDGSAIPILVNVTLMRDAEGKPIGRVFSLKDITERKRAEEKIGRLAKFPSENPSPVLRVAKDGTVLYANKAGLPLLSVWGSQIGQLLPDYWRKSISDVLSSGSSKDTEVECGNRIFSVTFAPVVDAGYVNLYGLDITERKLAEESIRIFKIISDRASYGTTMSDFEGNLLYVNKVFAQMHGSTIEELIGKNLSVLHSKEQMNNVNRLKEHLKKKGSYTAEEVWHKRKDGTVFPTLMNATVIEDEKGMPLFLSATAVDITERKQAEERYRNLVELAPDSMLTLDKKGVVTSWNTAASEISGYSKDEIVGKHFSKLGFLRIRDISKYLKIFTSLLRGKSIEPLEVMCHHKDGTPRLAEIRVSEIKEVDKIVGFHVIARDITERKRAEEKLKDTERKWISLVGNTNDFIMIVDNKGRIQYINRAILPHTVDQVIGKTLYDFAAPEHHGMIRQVVAKVFGTGEQGGYKSSVKHPIGIQWFDTTMIPIAKDGKVTSIMAFNKNITEQKKTEEALQESEERHRAIFEQAADSIVLIDAEAGALVEFNDKAHENLGYTREEFEKLKIPDFEVIESVEEVAKHIEKIIKDGADIFETKHRTKGGEIRDIQVSSKAISIRGRNFVQSIWRDITERKQAEETLHESEEKFRSLIENAPVPIFSIDFKGNALGGNKKAAELAGDPRREFTGKNIFKIGILPKKYIFKAIKLLLEAKARLSKKPFLVTDILRRGEVFEFTRKDGKKVTIELMAMGIKGKHGVEIMCIVWDITRYKKLEEELRQAMGELKKLKARLKSS